jgi:uncharacterized membrane protein YfcA
VTPFHAVVLLVTAALAGALNSVAGGGSFLTFPTLLFTGVLPIQANATSTVALWPGTLSSTVAYRRELSRERHLLLVLGATSLLGGLLGAILLLRTPQQTFVRLIPWLLLLATLLFTFGGSLTNRLRRRMGKEHGAAVSGLLGVATLQLVIAVYGGYFGGGIGILMLASLALLGLENIHAMNAIKTLMASCINGVAVATFIVAGAVAWPQVIVMVIGGIVGGYGGAHFARQIEPRLVRRFVILVGVAMTLYFFIRQA